MDITTKTFIERHYDLCPTSQLFPRFSTKPRECISCGVQELLPMTHADPGSLCTVCKRMSCSYPPTYQNNRLIGCGSITDRTGTRLFIKTQGDRQTPTAKMVISQEPVIAAFRAAMVTPPPFMFAIYGQPTYVLKDMRITEDLRRIRLCGDGYKLSKTSAPITKQVDDHFIQEFDGTLVMSLLGTDRVIDGVKKSWEEIIYYALDYPRRVDTDRDVWAAIKERFQNATLPLLNSDEYKVLTWLDK